MPATPTAQREATPLAAAERAAQIRRPPARPSRPATDDEILGLDVSAPPRPVRANSHDLSEDQNGRQDAGATAQDSALVGNSPMNSEADSSTEPESLRPVLDANPE